MSYENLLMDASDGIATITINRPDKLNALNDSVIAELDKALDEIESNPDIGGIILTGSGAKAFAAGADIGELAGQGPIDGKQRALRGQRVFRRLETSARPTVAAVNGFALGGGCELALSCHIRIAGEKAKFGQPEVNLGICPGYGGTQRLPRLVGKGRALELLLTGRMVDAEEAVRIGIANAAVPTAQLMSTARDMVTSILSKGPLAVASVIECVGRGLETSLDEGLSLEADHFGLLSATEDMREGMQAFLDKRKAEFSGK